MVVREHTTAHLLQAQAQRVKETTVARDSMFAVLLAAVVVQAAQVAQALARTAQLSVVLLALEFPVPSLALQCSMQLAVQVTHIKYPVLRAVQVAPPLVQADQVERVLAAAAVAVAQTKAHGKRQGSAAPELSSSVTAPLLQLTQQTARGSSLALLQARSQFPTTI